MNTMIVYIRSYELEWHWATPFPADRTQ